MASSSRAPLGDASNSGLTVSMLKRKLGEKFRDTGVLDEVKAHLRGTDAVTKLSLQTRRLSYGRVDGVAVT